MSSQRAPVALGPHFCPSNKIDQQKAKKRDTTDLPRVSFRFDVCVCCAVCVYDMRLKGNPNLFRKSQK